MVQKKIKLSPKKLSALKTREGWKQKHLAEAADIGIRTIQNAERGDGVSIQTAKAIANAYRVAVQDLLDEPDEFLEGLRKPPAICNAPQLPSLVLGREDDLTSIHQKLIEKGKAGAVRSEATRLVVHGWPGIGKTTLAKAISHDREFRATYPDGILWAAVGGTTSLRSHLISWMQAVGVPIRLELTDQQLGGLVSGKLTDKKVLFVIDDVYDEALAESLLLGGKNCATVLTTRFLSVAENLAPRPDDLYQLSLLKPSEALSLLHELAPSVVEKYKSRCKRLVEEIECLPLSLQVVGRMLQTELRRGGNPEELIERLIRDQSAILDQPVPTDMKSMLGDKAGSVSSLLKLSTDQLDEKTRDRFKSLSVFAPKPAVIDPDHLTSMWGEDADTTFRTLLDYGLIEVADNKRYQIHSLLVAYASSLVEDNNG